jgi:vanillate/3-O-methylgallate O-demethylase
MAVSTTIFGREALAAEIASPNRTTVTLRWDSDDVMDIYASLLRPGELQAD